MSKKYNFKGNELNYSVARLVIRENNEHFINLDILTYIKIDRNYLRPDNKPIKLSIKMSGFTNMNFDIKDNDSINDFLKSFPMDINYIRFVDDLGELYLVNSKHIFSCGTYQEHNSDTTIEYITIVEDGRKIMLKKTKNN